MTMNNILQILYYTNMGNINKIHGHSNSMYGKFEFNLISIFFKQKTKFEYQGKFVANRNILS